MISFHDWIKARESSPATRLRQDAANELRPPIPPAAIHSHNTAPPWQVERLRGKGKGSKGKRRRRKKKKCNENLLETWLYLSFAESSMEEGVWDKDWTDATGATVRQAPTTTQPITGVDPGSKEDRAIQHAGHAAFQHDYRTKDIGDKSAKAQKAAGKGQERFLNRQASLDSPINIIDDHRRLRQVLTSGNQDLTREILFVRPDADMIRRMYETNPSNFAYAIHHMYGYINDYVAEALGDKVNDLQRRINKWKKHGPSMSWNDG